MDIAKRELGTAEIPGASNNNPRILSYIAVCGYSYGDETPWCSAFVNWVLRQVGYSRTSNLRARSWLHWGQPSGPCYGAITVLTRTSDPGSGHVGFLVREAGQQILLLGGNQANQVSVAWFPRIQLLGYRWPYEKDFDEQVRT
jgi:uncharacterized protein (TIGR02594 family)